MASLRDVGVTTRAIVSDGLSTNLAAARQLGFNLHPENLVESVELDGEKVYFFLDYVHCLKLMRNLFATEEYLLDPQVFRVY
jgi:hypothetical protein